MNATFSVPRKSGEHIKVSVEPATKSAAPGSGMWDAMIIGFLALSAVAVICLLLRG